MKLFKRVLGIAVASALLSAGPASAQELPGCSQPISTGPKPTATDCLFILNVSVGLEVCEPDECVCAPSGDLPVSATDALVCLNAAIDIPTELLCPCGSTTTNTTTSTSTTTTMGPTTTLSSTTTTLLPQACPGDGDCLLANGTPGCSDEVCCDIVCEASPNCCIVWDEGCALLAIEFCDLGGPICPGGGSCFEDNPSPGCSDEVCCGAVCDSDPACCVGAWSGNCVALADELCDAPLLGACCVPDIGCGVVAEEDCDLYGGEWQGTDTSCEGDLCPDLPTGACCAVDICTVDSQGLCELRFGQWQGEGTDCSGEICEAEGACCLSGGGCELTSENECLALLGSYRGNDSDCSDEAVCDDTPPVGACCLASPVGPCIDGLTVQGCIVLATGNPYDTFWQGPGSTCGDAIECPTAGACCFPDAPCITTNSNVCAAGGGEFQAGTQCYDGLCFSGGPAACCIDGTCSLLTELDCLVQGGGYQQFYTCDDGSNICALGACCEPDGTCNRFSPGICSANGWDYQGDDTVCDPNPCP